MGCWFDDDVVEYEYNYDEANDDDDANRNDDDDDDDYLPKKEGEPAKEKGPHHKAKCHKGLPWGWGYFLFDEVILFVCMRLSDFSINPATI